MRSVDCTLTPTNTLAAQHHELIWLLFFQIIKLLDGKRSQAVGILISSLHLEMKDIQQGENYFPMSVQHV